MDRGMVYVGAIPQDTDWLFPQRAAMVGLSGLSVAVLGGQPVVDGLDVLPASPPGLSVVVSRGQIYAMAALDSIAYGSMAADPGHQILKQGILLDPLPLTLNPPGTAGYSQWFLIQCAYQDQETGAVVLPYYNSANPTQAWSGPNNSGAQQFTRRNGIVTVQIKAGVPAPTGSHVQPQPDPGWSGLAWVSVAAGTAAITAASIQPYPDTNRLPIKLPQLIKAASVSYTLITSGPRQLRAEEAGVVVIDMTNIGRGTDIRLPAANAVPGVPLRFRIIGREITPSIRPGQGYVRVWPGVGSDTFDIDYAHLSASDEAEFVSDGLSRWYWASGISSQHVSSYLTQDLTLPSGVQTTIPWPDFGSYAPSWRVVGFPSRFRIPLTGRYMLSGNMSFNPGAPNGTLTARWARAYINGVAVSGLGAYTYQGIGGSTAHVVPMQSASFGVQQGDYIEIVAYQNSGAPLNLVAGETWVQLRSAMG